MKNLLSNTSLEIYNPESMTFSFNTQDGGKGIIDLTGSLISDDICEVQPENYVNTPQVKLFVEKFIEKSGYYDLAKKLSDSVKEYKYEEYEVVISYMNKHGEEKQEDTGLRYYEKDDECYCENYVSENLNNYIDTDCLKSFSISSIKV